MGRFLYLFWVIKQLLQNVKWQPFCVVFLCINNIVWVWLKWGMLMHSFEYSKFRGSTFCYLLSFIWIKPSHTCTDPSILIKPLDSTCPVYTIYVLSFYYRNIKSRVLNPNCAFLIHECKSYWVFEFVYVVYTHEFSVTVSFYVFSSVRSLFLSIGI